MSGVFGVSLPLLKMMLMPDVANVFFQNVVSLTTADSVICVPGHSPLRAEPCPSHAYRNGAVSALTYTVTSAHAPVTIATMSTNSENSFFIGIFS